MILNSPPQCRSARSSMTKPAREPRRSRRPRLREEPAPARSADVLALPTPHTINMDILPDMLGYQLRRAQVTVFSTFLKHLQEEGITPGLFGLLVLIGANPGISQTGLANAVGTNRSLMVGMVDRLEKSGLILRAQSPLDTRTHAIQLSRRGQTMIARLKTVVREQEKQATAPLSDAERQTLLRLLCRLNGNGVA
jgi:DNA-binding MarR family transcriptional regulator